MNKNIKGNNKTFPKCLSEINSQDIKSAVDDVDKTCKYLASVRSRSSIRTKTKGLVLHYPLLTENSLSTDSMITINKALEHEYINLLAIAFGDKIFAEIDMAKASVSDLLRQYHTNIDFNDDKILSGDSSIDGMLSSIAREEVVFTEEVNMSIKDSTNEEINKLNEEGLIHFDEELNDSILNQLTFTSLMEEATKPPKATKKPANPSTTKVGNTVVSSFDYKKLNMLSPTIVTTTITVVATKNGKPIPNIGAVTRTIEFGVKAVSHPIPSEDIVYYLSHDLKKSNFLLSAIRWASGELKTLTMLFDAENQKKLAVHAREKNKNRYWWKKLEYMADSNKIVRLFNRKDPQVATATLIISRASVDIIKNREGINLLSNPDVMMKLFKHFFLLGFVVIDEVTNLVYIFDDTTKDYGVYSLNSLKSFAKEEINMENPKTLYRN